MKKVACSVLAVLALGALGFTAMGCGAATAADGTPGSVYVVGQNTGISVTGIGKIIVVHDLAVLNLGVQVESTTVAEAQQKAAQAMAEVMATLKAHGIADRDIATSNYSVYPVYRYDKDRTVVIGYSVSNYVTAKIRQVADAGDVIDAVALAGGDAVRINNIYFSVDNPEKYNAMARELAMADALARAQQLAGLGGVDLGKPAYITESGGYGSKSAVYYDDYRIFSSAAAPDVATIVSPGESELVLTVYVVYNIR